MRISTQIIAGHAFLIAALVALAAMAIGLVERMTRTSDLILDKEIVVTDAARAMEALLLRREIERRGGPKLPQGAKGAFEELSKKASNAAAPGEEEALAASISRSLIGLEDGSTSPEKAATAAGELGKSSLDAVRRAIEHSRRMGRSGVGLIAVTAVLALIVALYFGYWLSKSISQPLQRMARGLDAVTAGDLHRRFMETRAAGAVTEIAASLNQLVDRLQRSEAAPRSDLLLACAAVEKLLDRDGRAGGLLANGSRLIASNEKARQFVLARGSSFHWIVGEAQKKDATAVETVSLEGPGGERLGELVKIADRWVAS